MVQRTFQSWGTPVICIDSEQWASGVLLLFPDPVSGQVDRFQILWDNLDT